MCDGTSRVKWIYGNSWSFYGTWNGFKHFDKFERVYSGHYHMRSNKENIFYLGNPYEMYWNDVNDRDRGFHLFDTDRHTPVNNPYQFFIIYIMKIHQMLDITKYDQKYQSDCP